MDEAMQLLLKRRCQAGMVVTQRVDRNAGQSIEIAPALLVKEVTAFARSECHGLPGIVFHQVRHDPLRGFKQSIGIQKKRRRPELLRPPFCFDAGKRS
jgi:hypothetical protein